MDVKRIKCLLLVVAVLSLVLVLIPVSSNGQVTTTVGLSGPSTSNIGTNFTIQVNITSVTDLNIDQFDVTYNPTVFEIGAVGVTQGVVGGTIIPIDSWTYVPAGTPGTVRVSSNLHAGFGGGANGNGYLARIQFHTIGTYGDQSDITLSNVTLTNTAGAAIAKTINPATKNVRIPYPPITVSVSAPADIPAMQTFTARINVSLVENFKAYQFDLTYDSSAIQVIGVQNGVEGVTPGLIESTNIPVVMWVSLSGANPGGAPVGNTIRVLGNLPVATSVTGSGYIAEVHFNVLRMSGTSNLTISNGKLFDDEGNSIADTIPITWTGTTVNIVVIYQITTDSPLPTGEVDVTYSQVLSVFGGTGPYTWSVLAGTLPDGLMLNASTGAITGTPTTAGGPTTITFQVMDSVGAIATKDLQITIIAAPGITTTSPLAGGEVGVAYAQSLTATGGLIPYTWSVQSGTLPAGLTLNTTTGAITGTPTAAVGTVVITFQVADSLGGTATKGLSITIIAGPTITTTSPLPNGEVGVAYSQTLAAANGTPPYTWSVQSGTLPAGLTLNAATGAITGMPTAAGGPVNITFQVLDNRGGSSTRVISITIIAGPTITTTSPLPNGEVGVAYSRTLTATNGVPPYTWAISAGVLPNGLTFNTATGAITGTPTVAGGPTNITFRVTDTPGSSSTKIIAITIIAAPVITNVSLASGQRGLAYTQTLTGSLGTTPYTWSIQAGSLPAGLTLNATTGAITGTPTVAVGPTVITFRITDSVGGSSTKDLSITIFEGPIITTESPLPSGEVAVAYAQTLTATGGTAPYTWAIQTGALPNGLALNGATGLISGVPLAAGGPTAVTFRVTDAAGGVGTKELLITIATAPTITTTSPLPNGNVGVPYSYTLTVSGGVAPYTWSLQAGTLPTGLTLNATTGVISGTPTIATGAPISVTARVTDIYGGFATKSLGITITLNPVITTTSLANGEIGAFYSQTLTALGGKSPYTWSIQSGTLPAGLTLTPATGVIQGTPTVAGGPTSITFKVTDGNFRTATKILTITIIPGLSFTTTSPLPDGFVGITYSQTLAATGGTVPYTWSIQVGALPAGLALSEETGEITGTPIVAGGPSIITFRVADGLGGSATRNLSITIVALVPTITSITPGTGARGTTLVAVVINGTNFTGASAVTFSGTVVTASSITVINDTQLTVNIVIAAAAASGARDVTVTSPGGTSLPLVGGFIVFRRGDANGDGIVNMADTTKVERIILALDAATLGADANGDGIINMGDVTKIDRIVLGYDPI